MLQYEKKYWQSGKKYLADIDEAGRGPLAGLGHRFTHHKPII